MSDVKIPRALAAILAEPPTHDPNVHEVARTLLKTLMQEKAPSAPVAKGPAAGRKMSAEAKAKLSRRMKAFWKAKRAEAKA